MLRKAIDTYLMLIQPFTPRQLAYATIGAFTLALVFAAATTPSPAVAGVEPPVQAPAAARSHELHRVAGGQLLRECGRIADQCSGWIYVGLCRTGIREAKVCRYCERDCGTGEKRCRRTRSLRCKTPT